MRRESEATAARRSPQVKRRSSPSPPDAGAWMTARRSGSWRAARSNACEMQQSSAASAIRKRNCVLSSCQLQLKPAAVVFRRLGPRSTIDL
nr:unnamed protein product [Digitaria exilis]